MARNGRHGSGDFSRLLVGDPSDEGGGLPDLVEEDVWSVMYGLETGEPTAEPEGRREQRRRMSRGRSVSGLSLAFDGDGVVVDGPIPRVLHQYHDLAGFGADENGHGHRNRRRIGHEVASSAPLDVPAWPQASNRDDEGAAVVFEEGDVWMPPHEYIQRRDMATGGGSSGRVATSVLEGVGRTLKGRDMSRVRDAVWRQTGFFG